MDDNYERELNLLWRKHDVVLIHVVDPAEENIPKGAIYYFQDSETEETVMVNALKQVPLKENNQKIGNVLKLYTDEDYVKKLKLFFYQGNTKNHRAKQAGCLFGPRTLRVTIPFASCSSSSKVYVLDKVRRIYWPSHLQSKLYSLCKSTCFAPYFK